MNIYDVNGQEIASDVSQYTRISKNLLDDTRISRPPVGSTAYSKVSMESGYYINVSGWAYLGSNKGIHTIYCYDANMDSLGTAEGSGQGAIMPAKLPTGTAYVSVSWYANDSTNSRFVHPSPDDHVTLYVTQIPTEIDLTYIPHNMLDANMVYGNLDYANFNDEMIRRIKMESIRAANQTRHCLRIGNWNLYGAGRDPVKGENGNWPVVSRVLAERGLDICGFEEVKYQDGSTATNLTEYLTYTRPYQFSYGNTNVPDGTTWSPKSNRAMISRYEVVESVEIPTYVDSGNYNNRSFLYTKVALPRFSDCMGGLQYLAFYVIHPTVATEANQTLEWQVLINHLQANKCAFKIVVSDTNDWYYNSSGYPVHWAMLENVGLTSVNDGSPKTTTGANDIDEQGNPTNDQSYDHNSLDNIFVSSNIHVKDWNVVSCWDIERLANGKAVSDHDLIYADLEFDYSDLIVPMRPMTEWIAVIQNLTHCTSSFVPTYDNPLNMQRWDMTQAFSCTLTADTGYTLSSVTVKVGGKDKTSQYYSNGTVSVPASAMSAGDILITAVATEVV